MYPHPIRLRGPWECRPARGAARRVTMPCHWADVDATGRVPFARRFGYPGRIDDFERVWLVGEGLTGAATVALNDQPLGTTAPGDFEFDATPLLAARNHLEIAIDRHAEAARPWNDVGLVIRCAAYLHGVCVRDGLVVGEVRGVWQHPLELYLLRDGAQAGYQVVPPGSGTMPLRFDAQADGVYQLDLVNVSSVWHRAEIVK